MGFKQSHLGKHVCMFLTVTRSLLTIMVVFHNPHSTILGLISSMYALGAILAVPFVPYVTDTFGRKRSVQLGSTLMIIGATIQTASQNLAMFMASRIIVGLGISFAIVAASALIGGKFSPNQVIVRITECVFRAFTSQRARIFGIAVQCLLFHRFVWYLQLFLRDV